MGAIGAKNAVPEPGINRSPSASDYVVVEQRGYDVSIILASSRHAWSLSNSLVF
jgi:hypothetical protein